MMCEHCEGRVESAIKEIVGVKYASASHKTESVEVEADDSVSNEQIIAKIEGAGYKISQ